MKLSLKRAKELKMVFLDEMERTRTIPANLVQPFWEFYSKEFNPGEFSAMPCTCSPKLWSQMMISVTNAVNEAFAEDATLTLVEVPQEVTEEPTIESGVDVCDELENNIYVDSQTYNDEDSDSLEPREINGVKYYIDTSNYVYHTETQDLIGKLNETCDTIIFLSDFSS